MSFLGVIMVNDKKGEEKGKGFIVKDKRFSAQNEEEGSQIKEETKREATKEDVSEQGTSLPEINFSS